MGCEEENKDSERFPSIKAFVFDVDGTLMDTVKTFVDMYGEAGNALKNILGDEVSGEVMDQFQRDMYLDGGIYKDILDMRIIADDWTGSLLEKGLLSKPDTEYLADILKSVYAKIPNLYPDTLSTLLYLKKKGFKISFSTHSGDWGKEKIEYIWNSLGFDMNDLVYLSIPLNEKKDSDSWKRIVDSLELTPEEIAVVGDNPEDDIINALEAGVNTCVFVRRKLSGDYKFREEELKLEGKNDCIVYEVDSLKEIEELF